MSQPRRILYHHRIRADDGQAVHVRELIASLRSAGHEVLECALVPKTGAEPSVTGEPARPHLWQRLSLPRTAVEVLEVLYNVKGRALLRAAARTFRPDFVYERHALHCRAGLDVARELGVPLLLEVNSPMVAEMRQLGLLRLPHRAAATERAVLGGADAVLPVTAVLGELLLAAGARRERLHVIGNAADPSRYDTTARAAAKAVRAAWRLPDDAFGLVFVGYMRPWHRLDLVLEAMRRPGLQTLCLLLIGAGPALPALLAAAREAGLEHRVRALGVVPPPLVPSHVLAADAALVPAINAYASPLKLFDSLAAGVPTLAPDQPNLRETVRHGETGLLFAKDSVDGLVEQLGRLVHDRAFARRLGQAGRDSLLANGWTWAGNAARVVHVYEQLVEGGRA